MTEGSGGGVIIAIANYIHIDGSISSNGETGFVRYGGAGDYFFGGGGAGGSISMTTNFLTGVGNITSNGGNSPQYNELGSKGISGEGAGVLYILID